MHVGVISIVAAIVFSAPLVGRLVTIAVGRLQRRRAHRQRRDVKGFDREMLGYQR